MYFFFGGDLYWFVCFIVFTCSNDRCFIYYILFFVVLLFIRLFVLAGSSESDEYQDASGSDAFSTPGESIKEFFFVFVSVGANLHATLDEIDISTLGAAALPDSTAVGVETDVNSCTKSA